MWCGLCHHLLLETGSVNWHMCKQCVAGPIFLHPHEGPGYEAKEEGGDAIYNVWSADLAL